MRNISGALSIPFRLAVSVTAISLILPICMNCISSEREDMSRRSALFLAEKISFTIDELSRRPEGESRIIESSDLTKMMNVRTHILIGDGPEELNSSLIICEGENGWIRSIDMSQISGDIGICSREFETFVIDRQSGDIRAERTICDFGKLIVLEEI